MLHVDVLTFVGKRSVSRDHERAGNSRQIGSKVFGDAVDEILLFWVAPNIGEWKDDNRQTRWHRSPARRRRCRFCLSARPILDDRIGPYRTIDVFEVPLPQIGERSRDLTANMIIGGG